MFVHRAASLNAFTLGELKCVLCVCDLTLQRFLGREGSGQRRGLSEAEAELCNVQSIHISSDHLLPAGSLALSWCPLSPPIFVYHGEVDLCRLHLEELGSVGETQQQMGWGWGCGWGCRR